IVTPESEIFAHNSQNLRIRSKRVAIRPIAAEQKTIRAKGVINLIELVAISGQIERDPAIGVMTTKNFRYLDVYLPTLAKMNKASVVNSASSWLAGTRKRRQMIEDDPKVRNPIRQSNQVRKQLRCRIGRI